MSTIQRPIYDALPGLAAVLPCASFASLPTPLEQIENAGRTLWIKRDDLSHPDYGGNKVRKLEFLLAVAQAAGQSRVVTFGATGTHHGLATALFCRKLGMACQVLLFDQPDSPQVQANRAALQQADADCVTCGSLAATVARFYLHPARLRHDTLFLFAGGSGAIGTLAFINAALELKQQIDAGVCPTPERIYLPCSSGSTLAGLSLGMALAGLPTQVIGVQVADAMLGPIPACTENTIAALMAKTVRWLIQRGVNWPANIPAPILDSRWLGDGYGHATAEGLAAAQVFQSSIGLALDETYTAKAFAAVLADQQAGTVLYWHTLNSASLITKP